MTISRSSRTSVIIIVILLLAAVTYFFLIPQWGNLSSKQKEINDLRKQTENLKKTQKQLDDFVAKYKTLQEQVNTVNNTLPLEHADTPRLLANVEELSKLSGLRLTDIQIKEADADLPGQSTSVVEQEISIRLIGSYPAFQDFVLRLENNLRLMDVLSANLRTDAENANLVYELRVKTYYLK